MPTSKLFQLHSVALAVTSLFGCSSEVAQEHDASEGPLESAHIQPMTEERLAELILRVDDEAVLDGSSWHFSVADLDTIVIYDTNADRMRIVIPIVRADELDADDLLRLMQANFDTALDARYAIGQGLLWGTYIHPLSTLTDEELLSGLGQTANVVASFGASYSSGLFIFGSGDSAEIERQRFIEDLKKQKI